MISIPVEHAIYGLLGIGVVVLFFVALEINERLHYERLNHNTTKHRLKEREDSLRELHASFAKADAKKKRIVRAIIEVLEDEGELESEGGTEDEE